MTGRRIARSLLPWLVGAAIVVVIVRRVPVTAFRRGLDEGPHIQLALVDAAITLAMLATDSIATWLGLAVVGIRLGLAKLTAFRGATYVVSLLNYAVGQGGLGYLLHRDGVSAIRSASATLFLIGTTFATLLGITTATWAFSPVPSEALWWLLVGGCAAFALYLAIIVVAPAALSERGLLACLFDAKLRGHLLAIAARIPHVLVIVFGHWVAMRAWGIPVPFIAAATTMPAVVIAGVLPISPAGLGTTQVALVYFFSRYAAGATADDRQAAVLAFAIVHFVYCVFGQLLVGLACVPFARKLTPAADAPAP